MKGKMEKVWGHRREREDESVSCCACNVLFNMAPERRMTAISSNPFLKTPYEVRFSMKRFKNILTSQSRAV